MADISSFRIHWKADNIEPCWFGLVHVNFDNIGSTVVKNIQITSGMSIYGLLTKLQSEFTKKDWAYHVESDGLSIYSYNTDGFFFPYVINDSYWQIALSNFEFTTEKIVWDGANQMALKAAASTQNVMIAAKNVNLDLHHIANHPAYKFKFILVKSVPDIHSDAFISDDGAAGYYGTRFHTGDESTDPNSDYLSYIGDISRSEHIGGTYDENRTYYLLHCLVVDGVNGYYCFGVTSFTIPLVDIYDIDGFTISSNGKTATPIVNTNGSIYGETVHLNLTGSLDNGVTYNVLPFMGLTPNIDYSYYIKDQFDGIRTGEFTTTADPEIEVRRVDPFFKIENCNGLKHYEVNTKKAFFDNAAMKDQLYFNTQMHCYYQPVLTSNIITTQIKSSYRNIIAEVLNVAGQVVQTPAVTLKKQYTEQLDKRDCTFVRSVDGLNTYIYFDGGSVYEPNTLTVKETYTGTSVLPSFCRVGMFVELIGTGISGTYEVLDIIYDNTLQKWCLSIYYALPVATLAGIVQSIYNVNEWNIYEFDFVASALSGVYRIKVSATDTTVEFVPVLWYSEPIRVASSFRKHLEVTYTNPENINQIDYTTGIEHLINVPGRFVDYDPSQDGEDFRSDDNTLVILKRMFNRVIRLTAVGIPQYVAEKLLYASGHNELRVNDYLCKCSDKPEIEIYEKSNLYSVSMSLQLDEGVVITDSTGIVSEAANVLGSETDTVIGV